MALQTSFFTSTSTDYQDLLDDIVDFATNEQASTAVVNAAGSGYVVGDILTLTGGTSITPTTLRVLTLSGSAVATVEVVNAGSYSTNPGATGVGHTGGTGTAATFDMTYQNPWSLERDITNRGLVDAVIVSGGTGYAVNDTLTGDFSGTSTADYTLNVDSVSSGVITGVSVVTNGNYTVDPTSPDTPSVAPAGGSGASFTLTMSGQTSGDQREKLLKGIGSGSDEIYVGIRTYEDSGANAQNWELAGMTGHNLVQPWEQQPDISPGRFDALTSTIEGGAFVPLSSVVLTYWVNVTGRRILLVAKSGTTYSSMYLGFIAPFGTLSELPYPLLVGGSVSQPDTRFSSTRRGFASVCWPIGKAQQVSVLDPGDLKNGPLMLRDGNGSWISFLNAFETSASTTSTSAYERRVLAPTGDLGINASLPAANSSWIRNALEWEDFSVNSTSQSLVSELRVTPDSGGDRTPLIPQTLVQSGSSGAPIGEIVFGQLDGMKWAPLFGTSIVSEDTVTVGNIVHRIFQSGNKSEPYHHFAMEER